MSKQRVIGIDVSGKVLDVHILRGTSLARGNGCASARAVQRGEIVYPESPEFMAQGFRTLVDEVGVNIVVVGCGTGPAHIRALVGAVRK